MGQEHGPFQGEDFIRLDGLAGFQHTAYLVESRPNPGGGQTEAGEKTDDVQHQGGAAGLRFFFHSVCFDRGVVDVVVIGNDCGLRVRHKHQAYLFIGSFGEHVSKTAA